MGGSSLPVPAQVSCSLSGAGDVGLFPAHSRHLAGQVCWHGLPQCDGHQLSQDLTGSIYIYICRLGEGDLRTLTPKARCPPPTPQPSVPFLGFVSRETRPVQPCPAQSVCKNSTLPCGLPAAPWGPAAATPMGAGRHEVAQPPGTGWRSSLAGGGQGWPQGGPGALGGPWAGLGDSP